MLNKVIYDIILRMRESDLVDNKKINDKKVRLKRRKPMNKIKVAFLDRDGTITKEYEDEEWKNKTIKIIARLYS